jgi:hypothetical protein
MATFVATSLSAPQFAEAVSQPWRALAFSPPAVSHAATLTLVRESVTPSTPPKRHHVPISTIRCVLSQSRRTGRSTANEAILLLSLVELGRR